MNSIILVAETGSDLTPELTSKYNIKIVPMHVSFDKETLDDGSFPVEKICDYYHTTGKLRCVFFRIIWTFCVPEDVSAMRCASEAASFISIHVLRSLTVNWLLQKNTVAR